MRKKNRIKEMLLNKQIYRAKKSKLKLWHQSVNCLSLLRIPHSEEEKEMVRDAIELIEKG